MREISQATGPLVGGISQQPRHLRARSQNEAEFNVWSSHDRGLERRPPFRLIDYLRNGTTVNTDISRNSAVFPTPNGDVCVIDGGLTGDLKIFSDSTGAERTVNISAAAAAYLALGSASRLSIRTVAVGDTTLILNTQAVPALSGSPAPDRPNEWIIYVRQGLDGQEYEVRVMNAYAATDGSITAPRVDPSFDEEQTSFSFVYRPQGNDGSSRPRYVSQRVAYELGKLIHDAFSESANAPGPNGDRDVNWRIVVEGNPLNFTSYSNGGSSVIKLRHEWDAANALAVPGGDPEFGNPGYDYYTNQTLKGGDGVGGSAMFVIGENIRDFEDLPPTGAWDNFTVRVKGSASEDDDYYVQFDGDEEAWNEVQKWGLDNVIDAETMPVQLSFNTGTGEYNVDVCAWASRAAGDLTSAPAPAFIGNQIQDIALVSERLVLLTSETVSFSETGEPFNYWPTSVISAIATDPFDLERSGEGKAGFVHAVPMRRNLLVLSPEAQYVVRSVDDGPLTPESASLDLEHTHRTSRVNVVSNAPLVADDLVFFFDASDEYVSVWASVVDDRGSLGVPFEITRQCQNLIPSSTGGVRWAQVDANTRTLVLSTTQDSGTDDLQDDLWVYRWDRDQDGFTQSAWTRWRLPLVGPSVKGFFDGPRFYLVQQRSDSSGLGCFFGFFDFGAYPGASFFGVPLAPGYPYYLDFNMKIADILAGVSTSSYDAVADETTITFPMPQSDETDASLVFVSDGTLGTAVGEILAEYVGKGTDTIVIPGQLPNGGTMGLRYTSSWTPTPPVASAPSTGDPRQQTLLRGGRLMGKRALLGYEESGEFDVSVSRTGVSAVRRYSFFASDAADNAALETGKFRFSLGADADELQVTISTNSSMPARWSYYQWTAHYYDEGRRRASRG